jgi:type II secretory pathway pseudopilin PulG
MRSAVRPGGFSLIELLVAAVIPLLVMVLLLQMTGGAGAVWKSSSGKISVFQNARSAVSTVNRTLGRSTLNVQRLCRRLDKLPLGGRCDELLAGQVPEGVGTPFSRRTGSKRGNRSDVASFALPWKFKGPGGQFISAVA